jgi:2-dehydro-3-deoxyphosphogluconate aldolase/(4S)-4-hydroxy-2-oxoglutarate aldolase
MHKILQIRVVPVAVIDDVADAVPLAEALVAGGVDIIEVTFRTPAAEESVREIIRHLPEMMVGAGTILNKEQLQRAFDAGVEFGVAPGLNEEVVVAASEMELPFIPGVMTPSDVEKGLSLGCKLQKFFPAEAAGGVGMLKALAGPYAHTGVKFIPLGGLTAGNMRDYLALPVVAAIGGTWLTERKLIAGKQWAKITELTAEAVRLAS